MFTSAIHFHPSHRFAGKPEIRQRGLLVRLHSNGRVLALPTNIKTKDVSEWHRQTIAYCYYSCKKFYSTVFWWQFEGERNRVSELYRSYLSEVESFDIIEAFFLSSHLSYLIFLMSVCLSYLQWKRAPAAAVAIGPIL